MKLLVLLLFETMMCLNTSELSLNRTNFNRYTNDNNNHNHMNSNSHYFNQRLQNMRYNEVIPVTERNSRPPQIIVRDENHRVSVGKKERDDIFIWGSVDDTHKAQTTTVRPPVPHAQPSIPAPAQPSVPVAATLELPGTQKFSNESFPINNFPSTLNGNKVVLPDDKISPSSNLSFTKDEFACFLENKVYFRGFCRELLQKHDCDEGEWLVLDLKSAQQTPPIIKPKCAKKMCNKSTEFYWLKSRRCYDEGNNFNYETFCPPGNTVTSDYFGYGNCACKDLHALHKNGTCYPLYRRGPCEKGYLFVENNSTGLGECSKNPCINSSLVLYEKVNQCYELGQRLPCKPNFSFEVLKETKKPGCTNDAAALIAIGPPSLCHTDSNKQCQPQFKVEDPKKYIDRIIAAANNRKGNKNK